MLPDGLPELDPCVHCGFCLPACPTYVVSGDEAESPRGRIVLMRALADGQADIGDSQVTAPLDHCLGCRGCEPVCPSGVRYGQALERVRVAQAAAQGIPAVTRGIMRLVGASGVRRPALALAKVVRTVLNHVGRGGGVTRFLSPLPGTSPTEFDDTRLRAIAQQEPKAKVNLFTGCIMDGLFAHTHMATRRVLEVNGFEVATPEGQECCGALHAHAGDSKGMVELALANLVALETEVPIVVNSAGCGAMMKEYDRIGSPFASFAERVVDVTELLDRDDLVVGARIALRVAYDPPCHLLHAQSVDSEVTRVMESIPGLEVVRHPDSELCCGSAGSYSFVNPDWADRVLARKIDALAGVKPDFVATGNPGCIMQISRGLRERGLDIPAVHPVQLLDWSYAAAGYYRL